MWRIAWRNLARRRTRSVISATSIALSLGLLLATFGISDAIYAQSIHAEVKMIGGNVLVERRGWWQNRSNAAPMTEPAVVLDAARALPGVRQALPRVIVEGLLSSPHGNVGVDLRGIDPEQEATLMDYSRLLSAGRFLNPGDPRPLVLGERLAERLGANLGDRIVLTAAAGEGDVIRSLFRLTGVLRAGGAMLDETAAFTTLDEARSALGWPAGSLTQVGLVLDDDARRDEVARRLQTRVAGDPLEVLTWDEAAPELVRLIRTDKAYAYLMGIIMFLIVGFGIANILLMAVLERTREFGLLAALGLTPGKIGTMIASEAIVLAAVSVAAGLGLGLAVHAALKFHGLDIARFAGGGGLDPLSGTLLGGFKLRSVLVLRRWGSGVAGILGVILLSSIYPAWRASLLDPVEAMRTYE